MVNRAKDLQAVETTTTLSRYLAR